MDFSKEIENIKIDLEKIKRYIGSSDIQAINVSCDHLMLIKIVPDNRKHIKTVLKQLKMNDSNTNVEVEYMGRRMIGNISEKEYISLDNDEKWFYGSVGINLQVIFRAPCIKLASRKNLLGNYCLDHSL